MLMAILEKTIESQANTIEEDRKKISEKKTQYSKFLSVCFTKLEAAPEIKKEIIDETKKISNTFFEEISESTINAQTKYLLTKKCMANEIKPSGAEAELKDIYRTLLKDVKSDSKDKDIMPINSNIVLFTPRDNKQSKEVQVDLLSIKSAEMIQTAQLEYTSIKSILKNNQVKTDELETKCNTIYRVAEDQRRKFRNIVCGLKMKTTSLIEYFDKMMTDNNSSKPSINTEIIVYIAY